MTTAKEKSSEGKFESLGLEMHPIPHSQLETETDTDFTIEGGTKVLGPSMEHEFIPILFRCSPPPDQSIPSLTDDVDDKVISENLSSLRNNYDDDVCVSLHLGGDNEGKRRRLSSDVAGLPQ